MALPDDQLEARYGEIAVRARGQLIVMVLCTIALGGVMLYLYHDDGQRMEHYQRYLETSHEAEAGMLNALLINLGQALTRQEAILAELRAIREQHGWLGGQGGRLEEKAQETLELLRQLPKGTAVMKEP